MTAIDTFIARKAHIDELIGKLQAASADHFGAHPDEIHWGHCGDLGRIECLLEQATGERE